MNKPPIKNFKREGFGTEGFSSDILSDLTKVKVKYPLKWVGGKRQVCSKLVSQFPQDLTHYYEPFLGGGSVLLIFLHYKQKKFFPKCEKIYASDANINLINFWKMLKDYPEQVFNETQKLLIRGIDLIWINV